MENILVPTVLKVLKEDAYINIIDISTGEILFHGYRRRDRVYYTSLELFRPYVLTDLSSRYAHINGQEGSQLVITLLVIHKDDLYLLSTEETLYGNT